MAGERRHPYRVRGDPGSDGSDDGDLHVTRLARWFGFALGMSRQMRLRHQPIQEDHVALEQFAARHRHR
jgi:hypothetical protein